MDLLVEQSSGRKALPSLEFVMASIWEGFGRAVPAAETVRALGGVGGALTTRAQAVYESLGPEEREIARRAFVAMFQPGEVIPGVRRPVRVSETLARGQSADQVPVLVGLEPLNCDDDPIDIARMDVFTILNDAVANPTSVGLTNVTDSCISPGFSPPICSHPHTHLFWDFIHPTTEAHRLLSREAETILMAAFAAP